MFIHTAREDRVRRTPARDGYQLTMLYGDRGYQVIDARINAAPPSANTSPLASTSVTTSTLSKGGGGGAE